MLSLKADVMGEKTYGAKFFFRTYHFKIYLIFYLFRTRYIKGCENYCAKSIGEDKFSDRYYLSNIIK